MFILAIAEELKLKGLTGQTSSDILEEQEQLNNPKPFIKSKESFVKSTAADLLPHANALQKSTTALAIPIFKISFLAPSKEYLKCV